MTKIKIALTVVAGLLLSGCSSTPPELVKGRDFDTNYSHAYNIANQTALTRNDSPLRDFSSDEIEQVKTNLRAGSNGGDTSLMVGALVIATGNLTGAIDVVGGAAGRLASSDHIASKNQWFVALDASNFNDGQEAKKYAIDTINNAIIETITSAGNTLKSQNDTARYTINGNNYLFDYIATSFDDTKTPLLKGHSSLADGDSQYISVDELPVYGFNSTSFIDGKVNGYKGLLGYEQYLLDVTSKLPKGFYLYTPSFPESYKMTLDSGDDWNCITCKSVKKFTLYQVVPAIYTQGQKFEFIKP